MGLCIISTIKLCDGVADVFSSSFQCEAPEIRIQCSSEQCSLRGYVGRQFDQATA